MNWRRLGLRVVHVTLFAVGLILLLFAFLGRVAGRLFDALFHRRGIR